MISTALGIACGLVLIETTLFFGRLASFRRLGRLEADEPEAWPRVSVLMAARDEAHAVGRAVASRLADDYPDLELILIDDRSTDGTGDAALEAAGSDPRLRLLRVDELPAGWLGKVHAMERGLEVATGDWLLFSDGDVSVRPGTMRRAVSLCEARGIDLLALLPAFRSESFLVNAAWAAFVRGLLVLVSPRAVRSPRRKAAMGSGGFNLVRRSAYDRTPGLEHLRLETGDDVALGAMIKQAGGRLELLHGSDCVEAASYRSVGELLRGLEKNGSSTAAVPFSLLLLAFAFLFALVAAPAVALAVGPPWRSLLGGATLALYTLGEVLALWSNTGRWAPALLWPLGLALLVYAMIRATWLAHRNGGVSWRETLYSLEELAQGRRIRL